MKTILLLLLLTGTAFTDIAPVQIDNDIFADFTPEDETTLDCSQTHSGVNTVPAWATAIEPETISDTIWQSPPNLSEIIAAQQKAVPRFYMPSTRPKTIAKADKPTVIVPEPGVVAIIFAAIILLLYFRKPCSYLR